MSGPPPKPWERMNQQGFFGANPTFAEGFLSPEMINSRVGQRIRLQSTSQLASNGNMPSRAPGEPPPLPPRPDQQTLNSQTPYSRYGSYGYGYSAPSPYSSFSHYSPFLSNYNYGNRFGYGAAVDGYGASDNNFVRLAEESSRQAFSSIESIVQAFASVSMMLESTYHAVYSSFRAVLGVADHFSRLRVQLADILSTLALVRTIQWLCRKTLYMLGLIRNNPSTEAAWSKAMKSSTDCLETSEIARSRSSWPIIMFFGVVLGAPWLIWKLLSAIAHSENTEKWTTCENDHYVGTALYNFQGEGEKELSFAAGQEVILAPRALQPRLRGWLRATVDGKKVGLVPANYLKMQGYRKGSKHVQEPAQPVDQGIESENAPSGIHVDVSEEIPPLESEI